MWAYVTNGVHFPTWCTAEWKKLFNDNFDENFMNDQSNQEIWKGVYNIPDEEIWNNAEKIENQVISYIKWKAAGTGSKARLTRIGCLHFREV